MQNNNRPFFDPYLVTNAIQNENNNQNVNSSSQTANNNGIFSIPNLPKIDEIPDITSGITNTTKYYEQQYMYFKYLTQVIDYKTKLIEYERLNNMTNNMRNNTNQNSK